MALPGSWKRRDAMSSWVADAPEVTLIAADASRKQTRRPVAASATNIAVSDRLMSHQRQRGEEARSITCLAIALAAVALVLGALFETPAAAATQPSLDTVGGLVPAVPADGGYAIVVYGGGTFDQLVAASGCPAARAAFWFAANGMFWTYVSGTVATDGFAAMQAAFPTGVIPAGTALIGRCKPVGPDAIWEPLQRSTALPQILALAAECPVSVSASNCAHEPNNAVTYPAAVQYFDAIDRVRCLDQQDRKACVEAVLRSGGASAQAIAFYDATDMFLTDFQSVGQVDAGIAFSPWRANSNEQVVFLNATSPVIFVEMDRDLRIDQDPLYPALVAAFPPLPNVPTAADRLQAFPSDNRFESSQILEGGRERLVVEFNIVNFCHACGTGYFARFAFDFSLDGTLDQTSLLGICRGPHARTMLAGTADCPVLP